MDAQQGLIGMGHGSMSTRRAASAPVAFIFSPVAASGLCLAPAGKPQPGGVAIGGAPFGIEPRAAATKAIPPLIPA